MRRIPGQVAVPPPQDESCPSRGRPLAGHKAQCGRRQRGCASASRCRRCFLLLPPAQSSRSLPLGGRRAEAWRRPLTGRRHPVLRWPLHPRPRHLPGLPPPPLRAGCWRCSGTSSAPGECPAAALQVEPGTADVSASAEEAAGNSLCSARWPVTRLG